MRKKREQLELDEKAESEKLKAQSSKENPSSQEPSSQISESGKLKSETPDEAGGTGCPTLLEYRTVEGERWRVERFEDLVAEFQFSVFSFQSAQDPWAAGMHRFHAVASGYARGWLIVRRLFGVAPTVPSSDADPADFQVWHRGDLAGSMGIEGDQLQAELDAVRALWRKAGENSKNQDPSSKEAPSSKLQSPITDHQSPALQFAEDVLAEFGFAEKMFEVSWLAPDGASREKRDSESNRIERAWFSKRVSEWARYLREPNAATICRQALLNELYLRRVEGDMGMLKPGTREFRDLAKEKDALASAFGEGVARLEEMFPEMGGTAGKVTFRAVISDLIKGYHEFKAEGDNRLVDRIRTAAEIEVELRQSVQAPEPRYRLGLNVAIIEAIEGLHDPDWKPAFRHGDLKKLDAIGRAAVEMTRVQLNEPLVDLEKDEYPELEEVERAQHTGAAAGEGGGTPFNPPL